MKVAASSLSIGLQMSAPSGIGHGSIRSRDWAVGWTNEKERFGSGQEQEIASREVLVLACGCCSPSIGRGAAGADGRIGLSLRPLECQEELG
jgi:hypothetical protein